MRPRRYCLGDESLTLTEWASRLGTNYGALYDRIHARGWPLDRALTTPATPNRFQPGHSGETRLAHGDARRGHVSAEHKTWQGMINRCYIPKSSSFGRYGGRGITVCDEWRTSYAAFLEHMGRRPTPQHTIDRIDNDGNYEPGNCRWATRTEQAGNTRNTRLITWRGETKPVSQWARDMGVNKYVLFRRIWAGWEIERVMTARTRKSPRRKPAAVLATSGVLS